MGKCTECDGKGEITLNASVDKDPQREYSVECPICHGLYECDACGHESADCVSLMTYAGEGSFCATCRGIDE